jgi:hypothetical protein
MVQAAVHRAREASLRLARILDARRPAATRVWKPALGMVVVFFMGCLAVLPHAPQFVAVDRGMNDRGVNDPGANARALNDGYSAAVAGPSLSTVAVVPASFHTNIRINSGALGAHRTSAKRKAVHTFLPAREMAGVQLAARLNLNDALAAEELMAIHAVSAHENVPEFRTLVFVETSRYATADATYWSVQVWQMTVPSAMAARLARMPVAHKI